VSEAPDGDVTDEELMDRYCAGDQEAFDALFQRYTGRLVRFLTRMVGPAQAVDIAQVTFLKVHENRHRYRVGATFASWIFTIARNTALDHLRSAPKRREVYGIETETAADTPSRDRLRDDQVRNAIGKLPDDQRQVILLHWYGGLTFEEVAKVVGASGAAVRVRAHRAYGKLRGNLANLKKEGVS
jgi:RNA polymerase sigma-70 factor (ECF subfamily)